MKRTRASKSLETASPAKKASAGRAPNASATSEELKSSWAEVGGLIYCDFGSSASSKILGFDMDSTLIKTRSGKTFAQDENDWMLLYDVIPQVISKYADEGYRVVIFTNQQGVSTGQVGKSTIQRKIAKVVEAVRDI